MSAVSKLCRLIILFAYLLTTPAAAQSLIPGGGWSGPYWGVTGGGAWTSVKTATKSSDLAWSGHVGYGLNIASLFVGAEADATWGGATASSYISPLYSSTASIDWTASFRARAGLSMDGMLLYVTGGPAWSVQSTGVNSLGHGVTMSSNTVPGSVVGAGLEVKLLPFVSGRIEALRYDFSSGSTNFLAAVPNAFSSASWNSRGLDETVVRAGISLRFN